MWTNLAFLGLLSSGSVLCAVKFKKKFEEILPITCMGFALILFFFGIAGYLKTGVKAVCLLGVVCYLLTLVEIIIKRKNIKDTIKNFCKNFFTPGFVVYLAVFILLSITITGLRPRKWDEFSHWMDIVKVMTLLDDFGTNPASYSLFKSYPPAMALFQYLLQRVMTFLNPGRVFSEWRCFFAYQVYFIAVMMPVFKHSNHKSVLKNITLTTIIMVAPLLFFDRIYFATSIDPFLAMMTAAGFAVIMLWKKEEKDIFYSVYIWLLIATLVLSKDAGMIFAAFLAILYVADYWIVQQEMKIKFNKPLLGNVLVTVFAVLVPKMLWKWNVTITKAHISFESKIDSGSLLAVLTGKDDSYRSEVLKNYIYALFEEHITLGTTGIQLSYFMVIVIEAVLLYVLLRNLKSKQIITLKQMTLYMAVSIVQTIVYILGMCVIYMFNFSEGEAIELASIDRYLGTIFMINGLAIWVMSCKMVSLAVASKKRIYGFILLMMILLITPLTSFVDMLSGANKDEAYEYIGAMDILSEKILEKCDGDDKVYIIAQGDEGFERLVLKYNIRPNIGNSAAWSIGEPEDEDDVYTVPMTPEEWRKKLLEEDYDYVALYRLNDYFYETYDVLFDDPGYIGQDRVYEVNKETGILYCEREE